MIETRSALSSMMLRWVPRRPVRPSCRQRKKKSLSPSANTRFCHWMTAFTPCRQQFLTLLGRLCIGASNATASAGCRRSLARRPRRNPSNGIQLAIFHIDIAEVRTEEGKLYLFVAVDRTSKFAFAQLHEAATVKTAAGFLEALIEAVLLTRFIPC